MRVKLIILILQTLKHFNDVLRNVNLDYDEESRLAKNSKNIEKKLSKEIKYQNQNL